MKIITNIRFNYEPPKREHLKWRLGFKYLTKNKKKKKVNQTQ